ncbi:hypothetical protein [Streptomyces sp. NPDC046261]|uniref:hypothetical protein n=1 Tax=Streptomyces sp. NPDC046261 TaxID=3157200 RepID=UPI0033DBDF22
MSKDISHQGWRNREIEIERTPGIPTLIELRTSGWTSSFIAHGIERTAHREERTLISVAISGRKPYRFLLAPKYTHVSITRVSDSEGGGGISRWQLRIMPAPSAPLLTGAAGGKVADVLQCPAGLQSITYSFDRKSVDSGTGITHFSPSGKATELTDSRRVQGSAKIPGPGYLQIRASGPWEVSPNP